MAEDSSEVEIHFDPQELIDAASKSSSTNYEEKIIADQIILQYIENPNSFQTLIQAMKTKTDPKTVVLLILYFNKYVERFIDHFSQEQYHYTFLFYFSNFNHAVVSKNIRLIDALAPNIKLFTAPKYQFPLPNLDLYTQIIFINIQVEDFREIYGKNLPIDFFQQYINLFTNLMQRMPNLENQASCYIYCNIFELLNNIIETPEQLEFFRPIAEKLYSILCLSLNFVKQRKILAENISKIWENADFGYDTSTLLNNYL